MDNLIQTLKEEQAKFQLVIDDAKKHKMKMLKPKFSTEVFASIGVVAYIDTLIKRLEKGEIKL